MITTDYRVELDLFSGPLDLLLYLVRRSELDILDLQIASITSQFEQYLGVLEFIDLDLVGDFVVMASTLIEIKSREVLPKPEEELEEVPVDDNPRGELIERLLEYKRFKEAANRLQQQADEWQERFPRLSNDRPATGKSKTSDRIKEVELWDLVSALARVLERKVISEEASIRYDDTPISVFVEQIGSRVRAEEKVAFTSLFDETSLRSTIVGMFLAVLELLRHHHFRAEQKESFGEIWILKPLENESGDAQPAPSQPAVEEQSDDATSESGEPDSDSVSTSQLPEDDSTNAAE